jgi:Fe2+ or Zn2+ uptake regulation protein
VTLEQPPASLQRSTERPTAPGGRPIPSRQHRLVCRGCGRTEETGCVTEDERCLSRARAGGFTVDHAEVVFRGLCPACQAGETRPARMRRDAAG